MRQPAILSHAQSLLRGVSGDTIDVHLLHRLSDCSERYYSLRDEVREQISYLFAWGGMVFSHAVVAGNFCSEIFAMLTAGAAAGTLCTVHCISEHMRDQRETMQYIAYISAVCREGIACRAAGDLEFRDALHAEGNSYPDMVMNDLEYRITPDGMEFLAQVSEDC